MACDLSSFSSPVRRKHSDGHKPKTMCTKDATRVAFGQKAAETLNTIKDHVFVALPTGHAAWQGAPILGPVTRPAKSLRLAFCAPSLHGGPRKVPVFFEHGTFLNPV